MKPNKPLTREEKIKLLQAVKDGKLHPDALRDPTVYFFYESDKEPGIYSGPDNKKYNQQEYEAFCKAAIERNKNAIIWNEGKTYGEDTIRTYRVQPGNEPIQDNEM
jgi:hypothetical protein